MSETIYTDADADRLFGLSVSKLRTAQRYKLAKSAEALVGARYVRAWTRTDILRIMLAELFSQQSWSTFATATCMLASLPEHDWISGSLPSIRGFNARTAWLEYPDDRPPAYLGYVGRNSRSQQHFIAGIKPFDRAIDGSDPDIFVVSAFFTQKAYDYCVAQYEKAIKHHDSA